MTENGRFYQPKDTKDAMRFVEQLFNKYVDAPLTDELVAYNNKLIYYLEHDVAQEAINEGHANRKQKALQMAEIMKQWLHARLLGQAFTGKMQGFKMTSGKSIHYHVDQGRRKNRQTKMRKTMRK